MVISQCPNCNQRYSYNPYTDKDFIHDCNSGIAAVDNEDVLRLGEYVDDAGNTIAVPNALRQGTENQFFGMQASLVGADHETLTARGNRASTQRTHKKSVWFEIPKT